MTEDIPDPDQAELWNQLAARTWDTPLTPAGRTFVLLLAFHALDDDGRGLDVIQSWIAVHADEPGHGLMAVIEAGVTVASSLLRAYVPGQEAALLQRMLEAGEDIEPI